MLGRRNFIQGLFVGVATVSLAGCATSGLGLDTIAAIRRLLGLSATRALARLGGRAGALASATSVADVFGEQGGLAGTVIGVLDRVGMMKVVQRKVGEAVGLAAEKAAPVIIDQIGGLTVADADAIIKGPGDAATRLLEKALAGRISSLLMPQVSDQLQTVGAYGDLQQALGFAGLPINSLGLDGIAERLTAKAGSALFAAMADEERVIRANPSSTNDPLLVAAFGKG